MERVLERFLRRLCLRVFRAEHALLLKKNASTMNIAHVSMAQIAAPINVRADIVCYPTRYLCLLSQKTRGNSHFSWRLALYSMHCPRVYFNNIGYICTDSESHGNGLSALLC